ncbi:molybdopterin-synthase adenylyltransferase MoeB [Marinobacter halodurans]|uniref:Molybdopterin-synthase adenylyltransferase MoeB n=1 Tax=Marinobacter halodurans TaxID=2528979 RepID=A0ABY1ZFV7_9GAMM|nr:molybdopterin-synthase adenylyltransferase MoeB [Marinobacter halodurans]TBW49989.1 molybdopterin-synthase adenylyltransferase MoeB [Marinobacter halodurans]
MLTDNELMRYSRQLLLPQLDVQGQLRLKQARVLIVGAGGLGCPVALYLGGAGVGHLVVADDDRVEMANLQRQVAFRQDDLDLPKASRLAEAVRSMNPEIAVDAIESRLEGDALQAQVAAASLVVDCTDNFATRFAINRACVDAGVPLVSGAAIRGEGQVSVFDTREADQPCYQCLYPETGDEDLRCSEAGVIGPLVGMIGACQAMEAIKVLAGVGRSLVGRLLLLDAWRMEWREMKLARDPGCPVCGGRH